jgi:processive 1,2-diacylglycerol beta-glucosyltransferase
MITLKEKSNNRWIGSISYAQLQFLIDELAEEHKSDQDYWINRVTLEALKERGAEVALTNIIEKAMGDKDEVEFYWMKS